MGSSSKKHKKDRDSKKHKRNKSRSPDVRIIREIVVENVSRKHHKQRSRSDSSNSPPPVKTSGHSSREYDRDREKRHHRKHKDRKNRDRSRSEDRASKRTAIIVDDEYNSDSSDCVEVPLAPPAPIISRPTREKSPINIPRREKSPPISRRDRSPPPPIISRREKSPNHSRYKRDRSPDRNSRYQQRDKSPIYTKQQQNRTESHRSPSPIPENGAGDCLSIEETNKLRAKLGLKPLEVDSSTSVAISKDKNYNSNKTDKSTEGLSQYKDEWGEFLHKPANNLAKKAHEEKIREKLKQSKEKRALEDKLKKVKGLGESDDEIDDIKKWVNRSKEKDQLRKEADKRAKVLEEMDAEFGVANLVQDEKRKAKNQAYRDRDLKGLRVDHDLDQFAEGKSVILTLKDKGVLDEDDDALINVNMIDDERYKKNVENKKQNPQSYGYNVYEETYDEFGNPIERSVLGKYDEEIDQTAGKKSFTIGQNIEDEIAHKRKLLEIKTKLSGRRLETLQDTALKLASDTYSEIELAQFKKPKKKIKKIRQKLKADDLLTFNEATSNDLGSRRRNRDSKNPSFVTDDTPTMKEDLSNIKFEFEDEDDLQKCLSKTRRLKQQEGIIKKPLELNTDFLKDEIKEDSNDGYDIEMTGHKDNHITLDATAEFCRTLGDIPTYGMAGNRDEDSNDMMDFEIETHENEKKFEDNASTGGTWNSVNPDIQTRGLDEEELSNDIAEVAILDEEPDVSAGVAAALRLALSKGYLEKDDLNRPSNAKMAHLQAKNYTIDDKAYGEEDKQYNRRDRYHGPISEFRDKDNFKPNVKLDYIDDNGRILNAKEAFRYLSHKFHGKGPGKNKIEKRLKKMEQEGLMKTMSSTDTPLGTLTMLQQKQKDTQTPYVVLSGGKQTQLNTTTTISKHK